MKNPSAVALGKLSAEKRKQDPLFKEKMREIAKRPRKRKVIHTKTL